MKKIILILITFHLSLFTPQYCGAQSWLWARQGRNNTWLNDGHAIAMDNFHNAYLTGRYNTDTIIFNSDTLFSTIGKADQPFLVKYNENGNLLWAFTSQTSKTGGAFSYGIATDEQNNVCITGSFKDTIYFQSFSLENAIRTDSYNVFLVKFDENGNVLWAKQSKSDDVPGVNTSGTALTTDKTGNIYVTGFFEDTLSFDSDTLKSGSQGKVFLVKYSPSGNVLWAEQSIGNRWGSSGILGLNSIASDDSGYVYVVGYFTDTVYFGSQKLTSLSEDAFVVKYDSNGNVIWARQSTHTSPNENESVNAYGVCVDNNENVYIDGQFYDTVNFGNTTLINTSNTQNMYWAKFDKSGNILWAKQSYQFDTISWNIWSIYTDAYENLYITAYDDVFGYKKTKVVFDSDTLTINKGMAPTVFIKMDSSGAILNNYVLYGNGYVPLSVDSSGCYLYLGGTLDTSVVFGGDTVGPGNNPNYEFGWPFIARWSDGECKDEGINAIENPNATFELYPNPTTQLLNINFNGQLHGLVTLSIMDITGRNVLNYSLSIVHCPLSMDVSSLSSGMYFFNVKTNQRSMTQKFIKL